MKKLLCLIAMISLVFTGCQNVQTNKNAQTSENTQTNQSTTQNTNQNTTQKEQVKMENTNQNVQFEQPQKGEEIAVVSTNMGDVKIRLFPQYAPKAVENFKTHAKNGYYNGLIFHRVIKDFMIQGGDPEGSGAGGESIWGRPFEDEFTTNLGNFRGALCMANSGANTNGSQFFIVQNKKLDDNILAQMKQAGYPDAVLAKYKEKGGAPWLDFKHTVFGQVFEGLDIVDKIGETKVDQNDKPVQDVIIKKIDIKKYE